MLEYGDNNNESFEEREVRDKYDTVGFQEHHQTLGAFKVKFDGF